MIQAGRFGAVILAAGAGSRFGGRKLLTPLDGRPLLDHVLDAVRSIGPAETVVVLGHEADDVVASISWSGERRVVNPEPDRGLSSSLQVGFAALGDGTGRDELDGVFVVLGDQPLVDPAVFRALAQAEVRAGTAFVAPRYHAGGANPVLVLRPGRPWIAEATGDRGLGPILAAHPELLAEVELGGTNPDVDTRADLAEIAWADRVRRDREQVDRHREVPDGPDFYRPVTSLFRADPRRTDEPVLDALLGLAEPSDAWLDIGAGAGRYALPLALHVREVVAIEPSNGMRTALVELAAEYGIAGVRVIAERWPPPAGSAAATVRVDVALIAHLGYDVEAIGPFLGAMEAAAGRLCVAVLMDRQPSSVADPFWPPIHGEERIRLPALDALVDLLAARGRAPSVARFDRAPRRFASFDDLHGFIRRQLWLAAGGAKDRQLAGLLRATAEERDGTWSVTPGPQTIGVASWRPDGG